jgi:hypothetical protein
MLAIRSREVGGRDFPHEGQVVAVVGDVVPGTREIRYRVTFADRYRTEEEVCNALQTFGSWHEIVNRALASTAHLSAAKDEWAIPRPAGASEPAEDAGDPQP